MSAREKTQDDLDLETLIDLFDTALTSNNPAMKKAIKNLLLVATLIDSELTPEQRVRGPLRQALDDMRNLTRRMDRIESEQAQRGMWQVPINPAPMPGTPYTPGPTWIGPNTIPAGPTWTSPGTAIPNTKFPPGTIIGQSTTGTSYTMPNSGAHSTTNVTGKMTVSTTAFDDQYRAESLLEKLEEK